MHWPALVGTYDNINLFLCDISNISLMLYCVYGVVFLDSGFVFLILNLFHLNLAH